MHSWMSEREREGGREEEEGDWLEYSLDVTMVTKRREGTTNEYLIHSLILPLLQ